MEATTVFKQKWKSGHLINAFLAIALGSLLLYWNLSKGAYLFAAMWFFIGLMHFVHYWHKRKYEFINIYDSFMDVNFGLIKGVERINFQSIQSIEAKRWFFKIKMHYGKTFKISSYSIVCKERHRFIKFMKELTEERKDVHLKKDTSALFSDYGTS